MSRAAAAAPGTPTRAAGGVRVGTLKMSLPAADGRAGERIAMAALARVAEWLPPGLSGRIDNLELRVRPRAAGEAAMVDAIAEALLSAFERHGKDPHA